MSETQTVFQKFEEKTRKTLEKTREGIHSILDKMRNARLGLDESQE